VAWAAYLIPKALAHHEQSVRKRSVDRFSQRMRVLARREPTSARSARLVVSPARAAAEAIVTQKSVPPATTTARRAAVARATKRRRHVLALILVALTTVVALGAFGVVAWAYVAIPAGVLVAWLVACRVMVRGERGMKRLPAVRRAPAATAPEAEQAGDDPMEDTASHPAVGVEVERDPRLWDPVPVTLPTYVAKEQAPRSVRTIDLDATGVWSSGRSERDSALAREAEEAERSRRDGDGGRRAVGS
jgi:hypothetical protein